MKIRTRSRLILAATLIVFLIVLGFITQSVILQSFGLIEKEETTAHVQRFISQLNNEVENVAASCRDWANRDETAAIFAAPSTGQDPSRLFPSISMKNLGIDYIIVYNASGRRVFSETISRDGNTVTNAPEELDHLVYDSILPEGMPGGVTGRRGISSFENSPVILAGYPIQSGDPTNTSGGTLVMARLLDSGRIDDIDQMLQMDGSLVPLTPDSGKILSAAELEKAKDGSIVVSSIGDDDLSGVAVITGIENKPSFLLLKIETPRPVNQQVKKSILIVASAIIFLSIIFLVAVQLLLQRFILAPLSELDGGMRSIGSSGDLALRIPERGDEEILSLTQSFNQMLGKIQHQQAELHDLLAEIEQQRDDLHDARQALAERNQDLEELNRKANLYLDIYLDVVTYEISNALMGLKGYAEIIRETGGAPEKAMAEKIKGLAKKSDDVIRNIETISRIYKTPPKLEPINLCDVFRNERESWPGVNIHIGTCDRTVLANEMLSAVLDNIFANSLKYGGKDVGIGVDTRETGEGMIEVRVTDNGPGIPDVMKPQIFDRFAKDSTTRSSYGLGLHIVKMLIEGYGGKVWAADRVEGDYQRGAAICFTLQAVLRK